MCCSLKSPFPLSGPCSQDWQCLWLLEVIHFPMKVLGALDCGFSMHSAEDAATKFRGGIQILLDGGIHLSPTVCCLSSISVDLNLSLFALTEAPRVTAASCVQSPHSQCPSVYMCVQSIAGMMICMKPRGSPDDSSLLLETTL